MSRLSSPAGSNPIRAAAYWVVAAAITVISVVLGLMLFSVLFAVFAGVAAIVAARVWWVARKWRRQLDAVGKQPGPRSGPSGGPGNDDLTADYEVVDRRPR